MNGSSGMVPPLVAAEALTKVYPRGREAVRALEGVTFDVQRGEFGRFAHIEQVNRFAPVEHAFNKRSLQK